MLKYIIRDWCYESAVLDYKSRFNCKGAMSAIEAKDHKTIIVKFESKFGPWDLTITRTSKGCYVLINDCMYQHADDGTWEFMCQI